MEKPTYEQIANESLWVVKFHTHRETMTYPQFEKYHEGEAIRDIDTLCWEGQPKHLQQFFKDYYEQFSKPNGIFLLEEFYNVWIKS